MASSSPVNTTLQLTLSSQRTKSNEVIDAEKESKRFHEGKEHSHKANDPSM